MVCSSIGGSLKSGTLDFEASQGGPDLTVMPVTMSLRKMGIIPDTVWLEISILL